MEVKNYATCKCEFTPTERAVLIKLTTELYTIYHSMKDLNGDLTFAHFDLTLTPSDVAKMVSALEGMLNSEDGGFYLEQL